ncbi:MAG: hypothetical protein PHH57_06335 [Candidatus Omnitrophica bacterium]|nr:hypothetical protein [Candidatus Omnitrophota bacterium]
MARKESFDKNLIQDIPLSKEPSGSGGNFSAKISWFSGKAFGVIKFILGLVFLPFVFSTTVSFLNEFRAVDGHLQGVFWAGVISFLLVYLFIWEPAPVYSRGHKLLEVVFRFFKPMVNVAPFLLPVYTILIFIIYGLLQFPIKSTRLLECTMFLIGFSAVLHLVFSAKSIRNKKGDFLKGNYIFGFSFIFILNLALFALGFSLIFKEFSFVNFCNVSFGIAGRIFYAVFKQLFLF